MPAVHEFYFVNAENRVCKTCSKKYSLTTATGNLAAHIETCKNIHEGYQKISVKVILLTQGEIF